MIGLMLKDIYNIKNTLKAVLIAVFIVVVVIISNHNVFLIIIAPAFLFSIMSTNTILMDYNARWNRFAVTTPVNKKDIIYSKYILLALFMLSGVVLGFIVSIFFVNKTQLINLINLAFLVMSADLLGGGVLLYCTVIFNKTIMEKMQILGMVSYGLSLVLVALMLTFINNISKAASSFSIYCLMIFAAMLALFAALAYSSAKIYARMDIN